MKLSLFTGQVKNGEFVPNDSPVATAETSTRGIVTSGDTSYFEDFELGAGDATQQRQTLQEMRERFDAASYLKVTVDGGVEKRVPRRLFAR